MYTLLYTYIAVSHLIYLLVKRNMNVVHNSLASNKQTSVENPSIKPLTSIKAFYQYHQEPPERQRYCQANQRHKVTVYNHTSAKTYTSLYYILYFPDMNLLSMFGSYGIPMGFLWDSYGFLWDSYGHQILWIPSIPKRRSPWVGEGGNPRAHRRGCNCLSSPSARPARWDWTLEIPGDLAAETSSGDVLFT